MRRQSTYWEQVEQEWFEMRTFPMGILNNVIVAMYNLKKNALRLAHSNLLKALSKYRSAFLDLFSDKSLSEQTADQ